MSLKRANPRNRNFPPRSIAVRVTFFYALTSFGILFLAVLFLYRSLAANLGLEDRQFLAEKQHVLDQLLREHPVKMDLWEEAVQWESGDPDAARYFARILDARDQVLIETPGMDALLPPRVFAAPAAGDRNGLDMKQQAVGARSFLTLGARVGADPPGRHAQIALDVSTEVHFLAAYRRRLAMVVLLGVLIASVTGAMVVRRGLAPLTRIAQAMEQITARRLDKRIRPERWPRELTDIARAFNAMLDGLEDSFTRLSQFSADLAHELRTPLHNLMGETEVALAKTRSVEEYRSVLESAMEEYGHLASMMESLLFLARAERPDAELQCHPLDVLGELDAVREYHEALAQENGITVTCAGEARIEADSTLLRRALSNLLQNALKHTPSGGRVTLSAHTADDGLVEIRVQDSGCGIAPEHLPHLFDRFYRAGRSRSEPVQGAGLGLSIVKAVVALHRGEVSVHSDPEQGTTVTLRFPSAPTA